MELYDMEIPQKISVSNYQKIEDRTAVKDSTEEIDEARFVRQYNFVHLLMRTLCLCLPLMNLLLSVAPSSSSVVTMAILIPHWIVNWDGV